MTGCGYIRLFDAAPEYGRFPWSKPTFEPNVSSGSYFFSFTSDSRPLPGVGGTARCDPFLTLALCVPDVSYRTFSGHLIKAVGGWEKSSSE